MRWRVAIFGTLLALTNIFILYNPIGIYFLEKNKGVTDLINFDAGIVSVIIWLFSNGKTGSEMPWVVPVCLIAASIKWYVIVILIEKFIISKLSIAHHSQEKH